MIIRKFFQTLLACYCLIFISHLPVLSAASAPSLSPTELPSVHPISSPSSWPSSQPSTQPTYSPFSHPSSRPSAQPTEQPQSTPTMRPTSRPSREPSCQPTTQPSTHPTKQPFARPTGNPSLQPSSRPSSQPSTIPSSEPTTHPSSSPSQCPSAQPTTTPSQQPSSIPSLQPSVQPSSRPSYQPFATPSAEPTTQPSNQPTIIPSNKPSRIPSGTPTSQPSSQPSVKPSLHPSSQPTSLPTSQPSDCPSSAPSSSPSTQPSRQPSRQPTRQPSQVPTSQPSSVPSTWPSSAPTAQPSTLPSTSPSTQPTSFPSSQPTTHPSTVPTSQPSSKPTSQPTNPTSAPSNQPSSEPTGQPSSLPTSPTSQPSVQPSSTPTTIPSTSPSTIPTMFPSGQPSRQPTGQPFASPTCQPSGQPTGRPSRQPSCQPSSQPSRQPSRQPNSFPSAIPSCQPSSVPSSQPVLFPTSRPTIIPSCQPSTSPSNIPTSLPSCGVGHLGTNAYCIPCEKGTFADSIDLLECKECPIDSYTDETGQEKCIDCLYPYGTTNMASDYCNTINVEVSEEIMLIVTTSFAGATLLPLLVIYRWNYKVPVNIYCILIFLPIINFISDLTYFLTEKFNHLLFFWLCGSAVLAPPIFGFLLKLFKEDLPCWFAKFYPFRHTFPNILWLTGEDYAPHFNGDMIRFVFYFSAVDDLTLILIFALQWLVCSLLQLLTILCFGLWLSLWAFLWVPWLVLGCFAYLSKLFCFRFLWDFWILVWCGKTSSSNMFADELYHKIPNTELFIDRSSLLLGYIVDGTVQAVIFLAVKLLNRRMDVTARSDNVWFILTFSCSLIFVLFGLIGAMLWYVITPAKANLMLPNIVDLIAMRNVDDPIKGKNPLPRQSSGMIQDEEDNGSVSVESFSNIFQDDPTFLVYYILISQRDQGNLELARALSYANIKHPRDLIVCPKTAIKEIMDSLQYDSPLYLEVKGLLSRIDRRPPMTMVGYAWSCVHGDFWQDQFIHLWNWTSDLLVGSNEAEDTEGDVEIKAMGPDHPVDVAIQPEEDSGTNEIAGTIIKQEEVALALGVADTDVESSSPTAVITTDNIAVSLGSEVDTTEEKTNPIETSSHSTQMMKLDVETNSTL